MPLPESLTLKELQSLPLEDVIESISSTQRSVTVILPSGKEIVIQPKQPLKTLPLLEGHVPHGWKDAIYGPE